MIRAFLEALHHFRPVVLEGARASAPRLVAAASIRLWADDHAACASVLSPEIDASQERPVLLSAKSPWELDAQFFEELHGVDVGQSFEPSGHDRPCHAKRSDAGLATLGIDRLRLFLRLYGCRNSSGRSRKA